MSLDLIGIGFGPSHVALSICIDEYVENSDTNYKLKFFERKPNFGWHTGMQLPNTYLQVSFLKDLVTQRNPRSKYTFLNFLYETKRLNKFINIRQFEPTRIEFEEYLKWVALDFEQNVKYNYNLKHVEPNIEYDGSIKTLKVTVENIATNETETHVTKNLSLAMGGTPKIPKIINRNHRIVHSFNFKQSSNKILESGRNKPLRFAVIGGGQSAIEMLLYVHLHFPEASVDSLFSTFRYQQSDSSIFVNEVFFNDNVDVFYSGNQRVKKEMMQKNTNYGVADEKELKMLYKISYEETFMKKKRLNFKNLSKVNSIDAKEDGVLLEVYNLESEETNLMEYDYVFLGTGFKKNNLECLQQVKDYLFEKNGNYEVNRDYSLKTDPKFESNIYLIGHSEEQHGITNTLLSVNALRSNEVVKSLMENNCVNIKTV
jgi:L-ornithine N5-oxygenase